MSVTYTALRKQLKEERALSNEGIATMLGHLDAFGVRLEALAVAKDGTVTVTVSGEIRKDQLAHLGLVDPQAGGKP